MSLQVDWIYFLKRIKHVIIQSYNQTIKAESTPNTEREDEA